MGKIILFNDYLTAAAIATTGGQGKPEKEVLCPKYMAKFAFPDFLIAP